MTPSVRPYIDSVRRGSEDQALPSQRATWPVQSRIVSVTSSKGNEGRDDLDQRIRIEGVGIIAFGQTTALDEGAEVRMTLWRK